MFFSIVHTRVRKVVMGIPQNTNTYPSLLLIPSENQTELGKGRIKGGENEWMVSSIRGWLWLITTLCVWSLHSKKVTNIRLCDCRKTFTRQTAELGGGIPFKCRRCCRVFMTGGDMKATLKLWKECLLKIKLFKVYVLVVFIASQLNDECDVQNVLDFHFYTFDKSA